MSRREFSAKTKLLAFQRAGGRCEECGIKLLTGEARYECHHQIPDRCGGGNDLSNARCLCRVCHAAVSSAQARTIAKVRRIERRHAGIRKPRRITGWKRFDGSPIYASRER
jgi:5-methylcytosine-specific restriction protein A